MKKSIPTKKGIRHTSRPKDSVFGWLRVLKSVDWLEAMGVRQGSGRGINIVNFRRSLPLGGLGIRERPSRVCARLTLATTVSLHHELCSVACPSRPNTVARLAFPSRLNCIYGDIVRSSAKMRPTFRCARPRCEVRQTTRAVAARTCRCEQKFLMETMAWWRPWRISGAKLRIEKHLAVNLPTNFHHINSHR
jgi:hypothetical protein